MIHFLGDYTTIILATVAGLFILFMRIQQFRSHIGALHKAKERHDFVVYDKTLIRNIINITLIFVSTFFIVYFTVFNFSDINAGLAIIAVLSFVSELFSNQIFRKVYYDDSAFFFVQDLVAYRSVATFKKRHSPFVMDVILHDRQTVIVPSKFLLVIQEKMVANKERKKERKKK